ncbi:MAG: thermonuclease family protein [Acidimicrobiales bacterium]
MRRLAVVVLVVFFGLGLAACGGSSTSASLPAGQGTIVRVVDGDTVVVHIGGVDEDVRLIGIDTPETKKPDHPVECYGLEASHRAAELLAPGTVVRLERDAEARDRYDRLLAYLYRVSDGMFIEDQMLREGLAGTLAIAPNTAHEADLSSAAAAARLAGTGLWTACGGNHVVPGAVGSPPSTR